MQNHIIFTGHVAGASSPSSESYQYLKARVTPTLLAGCRRISAFDLIAVTLHDGLHTDAALRTHAVNMWYNTIAPTFSSPSSSSSTKTKNSEADNNNTNNNNDATLSFNFNHRNHSNTNHNNLEPVLTLKQAFQVLLRLPTTPRLTLHRAAIAQAMLQFFADLEPSVAEVRGSPACASLLTSSSSESSALPVVISHDDTTIATLRTRLADAETALLTLLNHNTAAPAAIATTTSRSKKRKRAEHGKLFL